MAGTVYNYSMSDLTPRQANVLRFIQRSLSETGMPPTRAEIAAELGFRSPNAAEEHLRALRFLVDLAAAIERTIDQRGRLDLLANVDTLTGLHNRRGLDLLATADGPVSLLICDLDHFKVVNDRHGHETGDHVLEHFAKVLHAQIRDTDIPVRLGGDEFCVVLPRTGHDGALVIAERIRAAAAVELLEVAPGGVTVSIGVASSAADSVNAQTLLAAADRGLYRAKQGGRDRTDRFTG